ncbi:unnamed protein product [Dimorphilus gyrociliatus]|uniref:Mediator of RNA polymerase II transcription subunit 7 n=1 Tax=Dimorphilus gyrociliatus TaxID=2664684 RepID=A0A7I8W480_9ANNE|nr:unnamed protein product [Dimorphilus gyrociliatus]
MAANTEQQQQAVSALPLPPSFYENYTDENVKNHRAPPPPLPPSDQEGYSCFGMTFSQSNETPIVPPLESQNVERLHPESYEHKRELLKMNHSLLCAVLDLLHILASSADSPQRAQKLADIYLILIHMQHLINELRPVQARDALAAMMSRQVEATNNALSSVAKIINEVANIVNRSSSPQTTHVNGLTTTEEENELYESNSTDVNHHSLAYHNPLFENMDLF